jgi:hypothetical protein
MAINYSHISNCGSFPTSEKSALVKTFREVEADIDAGGAFTPTAAPAEATEFGDLGDATDYVNSLRAALIASGILTEA